jgi:hypothetical protein
LQRSPSQKSQRSIKSATLSDTIILKRVSLTNLEDSLLTMMFGGLIMIWTALMIIWMALPSQSPKVVLDTLAMTDSSGNIQSYLSTPRCFGGSFRYVMFAAMMIQLGMGAFVTYKVKDTPNAFNESQWLALGEFVVLCVFVTVFLLYKRLTFLSFFGFGLVFFFFFFFFVRVRVCGI